MPFIKPTLCTHLAGAMLIPCYHTTPAAYIIGRAARWVEAAGSRAYLYYWSYIPGGANGRYPSLAHHACEQPFVFHVTSETAEEAREDRGMYHIQANERALSAQVVRWWASMAARGAPDAGGNGGATTSCRRRSASRRGRRCRRCR